MASIIEAILLWKLKQKIKEREVELSNEWRYQNIRILHTVNSEEIIAGKRRPKKKKLEGLDFVRIVDLCLKYKIIDRTLSQDVNKARLLRNRLHIGGLKAVEKEYTREDMGFVFDVAHKVKEVISRQK